MLSNERDKPFNQFPEAYFLKRLVDDAAEIYDRLEGKGKTNSKGGKPNLFRRAKGATHKDELINLSKQIDTIINDSYNDSEACGSIVMYIGMKFNDQAEKLSKSRKGSSMYKQYKNDRDDSTQEHADKYSPTKKNVLLYMLEKEPDKHHYSRLLAAVLLKYQKEEHKLYNTTLMDYWLKSKDDDQPTSKEDQKKIVVDMTANSERYTQILDRDKESLTAQDVRSPSTVPRR